MELHLTTKDEPILVYVNGRLVGEIAVGAWEGRDSLLAEVQRARVLERIPYFLLKTVAALREEQQRPDHCLKSEDLRTAAFGRGFSDGLEGRTVPHGSPAVPPVSPESSRPYLAGYQWGEVLGRCAKLADEVRDERDRQEQAG